MPSYLAHRPVEEALLNHMQNSIKNSDYFSITRAAGSLRVVQGFL
jgi:hypothetical protein